MKRIIFTYLFMTMVMLPAFAYNTTISSYLYKDSETSYASSPSTGSLPMGVRRVQFRNLATDIPELETALSAASGIFTNAMLQEGIDLVSLKVDVLTEDLGPDDNVLCKVEINYADTVGYNINYPYISEYETIYNGRVLLPMAMINQSKRESGGVAMRIKLRPDVPYHCDTTAAPEDKYDAITIILRALAMGCGIQSTFNPTTLTVGYDDGQKVYINAFDTQIFNGDEASLVQVADGDLSVNSFFAGKSIYAYGRFDNADTRHIYLFNDKQINIPSVQFTDLTTNTITPDNYTIDDGEDFHDLLEVYLYPSESLREVTPYTMALLRQLGWMYDYVVGEDDYADLYASKLQCSGTVLAANTNYSLTINKSGVWLENNLRCELQSNDSTYVIGNVTGVYNKTFSYSSIPSNVQWRRNPITKNIVGQIVGTAGMFVDETKYQTKVCDIEIPYRPNNPIVHRSESAVSANVTLNLSAFANGSNTYTLSYFGLADSVLHTSTITANAIDTTISLPATQLYDFSIYGTNAQGNSNTYHFTMGASVVPELYLNIHILQSTLRYYLDASHSQNIPCVNISSVTISNPSGYIFMTPNAGPGDAINLSSLARGYYILTVVANGQPYSKVFYKR